MKPLEWKFYPQAFPPCWCARTPFGDCVIEEESGSDGPTYAARSIRMHVVARTDGLPEAKSAAYADYEQRVLSALADEPQNENDPPCGQVLIDGVWETMHDLHAFNGYAADGYQTRPASGRSGGNEGAMLEAVATALRDADENAPSGYDWRHYKAEARAAIEAMMHVKHADANSNGGQP